MLTSIWCLHFSFFFLSHFDRCVVTMVLIFISLGANNVEYLFTCLLAICICMSSPIKCSCFYPFSLLIVCILLLGFERFLSLIFFFFKYSRYQSTVGHVVYKYFPQSATCNLSFHPFKRVFHRAKVFFLFAFFF